jgi:plastocyanin
VSPRISKLALTTCALALVPVGLAHAATYTVDMGTPTANAKAFQKYGADVNAFFPSALTIHVGDNVKFAPVSFHNLDIPKKGGARTSLVAPAGTIAGDNDPAGAPYWFNGQPNLQFNPALLNLAYGKSFTYTGKNSVQSGLPLGNQLKPVSVKFTKTGTFTYYCDIHAGMKAKIHVVAKTAKAPSVKSAAKAIAKQAAAALKTAKSLQNPTIGANDVQVGNSGKGGVEIFSFFPTSKAVAVGTTLTFKMSPQTLDVHTATTGPGDPEADPNSFLGKLAGSIGGQPPFDEAGVYPSDQPPGPASLTPTLHGNGFWGTGFMGGAAAAPLPTSGQVKIAAAGTYNFYCLIHPFMHGTVIVH